jgi:hypothetical protein
VYLAASSSWMCLRVMGSLHSVWDSVLTSGAAGAPLESSRRYEAHPGEGSVGVTCVALPGGRM